MIKILDSRALQLKPARRLRWLVHFCGLKPNRPSSKIFPYSKPCWHTYSLVETWRLLKVSRKLSKSWKDVKKVDHRVSVLELIAALPIGSLTFPRDLAQMYETRVMIKQ